jgi:hypothetical protein
VCDEPQWKAAYDDHPTSVQLASACISTSEAGRLLAEGAAFESVVLLNGAGAGLDAELAALRGDGMRVNRLQLHRKGSGSLERIHGQLADRPVSYLQFVDAG